MAITSELVSRAAGHCGCAGEAVAELTNVVAELGRTLNAEVDADGSNVTGDLAERAAAGFELIRVFVDRVERGSSR